MVLPGRRKLILWVDWSMRLGSDKNQRIGWERGGKMGLRDRMRQGQLKLKSIGGEFEWQNGTLVQWKYPTIYEGNPNEVSK